MSAVRGFERSEYLTRTQRAQEKMQQVGLAALLLTTETEVRYFSGYLTRFWESPTRPWFLLVPAVGAPVAVIPSIGAALMSQTWIQDIRTWSSPDLVDDGVSLLAEALREYTPSDGVIGVPDGHETYLRMPLADYTRLSKQIESRTLGSDKGIIRALRMCKSPAEIAKIRHACSIADKAFAKVPNIATQGSLLDQVFRDFQILCLEAGADWVPYIAGGAGQGGYSDVISPAQAVALRQNDVLMLDTGLVWDGYFCDYDRNWSIGPASAATRSAHARLLEATMAGFAAAQAGASAADVYHAMAQVLPRSDTGTGRLGHGLGMSLTEWPSLIANDNTPLAAGMVLTLEPSMGCQEGILVHEENIVITEQGPQWLSQLASPSIMEI